jgi:hypothetical protein
MPYGWWLCADGRQVLYNRQYIPLLERRGTLVEPANPREWVHHVRTGFFYHDSNAPYRCAATRRLLTKVLSAFRAGDDITQFLERPPATETPRPPLCNAILAMGNDLPRLTGAQLTR